MDTSSGFHIALYVLAIETFLFFAVVAQTAAQEPMAHAGVARTLGLAFLMQSLAALVLAIASSLRPESRVVMVLVFLLGVLVLAGFVAAMFGSAVVVFPERAYAPARWALLVLWAFLFGYGALRVQAALRLPVPVLPYAAPTAVARACALVQGGMVAVAAACLSRSFCRGKMRGRNGAMVLLLGTLVCLGASALWTYLVGECEPLDVDKLRQTCPLPERFDHNVLYVIGLVIGNVLSAEGVLRLMAVGEGDSGYSEIP